MTKERDTLGQITDVDKPKNTSPDETYGGIGVAIYGGYIQSNEKDSKLVGSQKNVLFSENLVNISIIGAGVRFFLNMVANATWTATPSDKDDSVSKEYAELVDDILNDMNTPWKRVVRKAAMYKFYGFSIQEWTAKKREDGVVGFLDVEPRSNATIERWDVTVNGDVVGVIQRVPQTSKDVYLERDKIVYIVDDALSDSPEGLGLFRHMVTPAKRLQRYEQLEGFGYETDLRGIPVARAPLVELSKMKKQGIISEQDFQSIITPIKNFVSNHVKNPALGLVLDSSSYTSQDSAQRPSGVNTWDVELLKGSVSTSQQEMNIAINRINHEIARLVGVEHLLLGVSNGTQALSKDKSDNFFLMVDSALSELAESFEKDLIGPIWDMNQFPKEMKPSLTPSLTQFQDVESIAGALSDLANAGAPLLPNDPVVDEIYELMGLSKRDIKLLNEEMLALQQNNAKPNVDDEIELTEQDDDSTEV